MYLPSERKAGGIEGLFVLHPKVVNDNRGLFFEAYVEEAFDKEIFSQVFFVQDNESLSNANVLRGLHYQVGEKAQSKLVRCVYGRIFDVAVDLRKNSKTFGQHFSIELTEEDKNQLFIPKGFAHGFYVLSHEAIIIYKTDNYWSKDHERAIIWNDKDLNIKWPLVSGMSPIVNQKDAEAPKFIDAEYF